MKTAKSRVVKVPNIVCNDVQADCGFLHFFFSLSVPQQLQSTSTSHHCGSRFHEWKNTFKQSSDLRICTNCEVNEHEMKVGKSFRAF